MDKYKIDSHKLNYHPSRVSSWLKGENIYPIYIEISPIGICNHRCVFCALDFMGYKPNKLDLKIMLDRIPEMGALGVKSIMYAGEGEPFLHKNLCEMVRVTKKSGIDVAITTNGVLMNSEKAEKVIPHCSWIKISINASTPSTYATIHKTKKDDFRKVIDNIAYAVKFKKTHGHSCTLGMQMVLLPENCHEAEKFVLLGKELGVDYVVIKPYSQHPLSLTRKYEGIKYFELIKLDRKISKYSNESFNVIFRSHAMKKWDTASKSYTKCLALPFWSYISADGNVWGCSMFLGDDRFLYGNIKNKTFKEIWEGEKRRKSLEYVANFLDIANCRINCRMDSINEYLYGLKNPSPHVNFI